MRFLGFDSCLLLSPHPDDVELSMFGTISRYRDTVFNILTCSKGTQNDPTSSQNRFGEIRQFWDSSELKNVRLHFMPHLTPFFSYLREDEWVERIGEFLPGNRAVFTPPEQDSHFEHQLVCRIGQGLIRQSAVALIQYKTLSTLHSWTPNLFVDVSEFYETKVERLQDITSQANRVYFGNKVQEAYHSDMQCVKKGILRTEQYKVEAIYG